MKPRLKQVSLDDNGLASLQVLKRDTFAMNANDAVNRCLMVTATMSTEEVLGAWLLYQESIGRVECGRKQIGARVKPECWAEAERLVWCEVVRTTSAAIKLAIAVVANIPRLERLERVMAFKRGELATAARLGEWERFNVELTLRGLPPLAAYQPTNGS